MLEHIVLFDYNENIKKDNEEEKYFKVLNDSVETLKDIKGVKNIAIKKNLSELSDLVFYVFFDTKDDLLNFQNDPKHLAHKNRCKNIVCNRKVIDFYL